MKDKLARYHELKRRERALALTEQKGITYEDALAVIEDNEKRSIKILKQIKNAKSKSAQRKEKRKARDARNRDAKSFGNKLTPGAPPLQGGAPGLGKKS